MDATITWTYRLVDYVSPTIERIQTAQDNLRVSTERTVETLEGAEFEMDRRPIEMVTVDTAAVRDASAAEDELAESVDRARSSIDSQNISFSAQMIAVTSTHRGMLRLTSSFSELGLISKSTEASLVKLNAVLGVVVGMFQLFKGAVYIVNALKQAEIGLAAVETYRSVLTRGPLGIAMVAAGIGAAAGIGGYLVGQGSQTNVTQNVTFGGGETPDQRTTARETLALMGG